MAKGDKKPVVMESDRAVPSGIATLDSVGNVPFAQLGNVVRPNLLDNWYVANPVNQRGKTEYGHDSEGVYCIDRWKKNNRYLKVTVENGFVRLTKSEGGSADFIQYLDKNLTGKTITISVLFADGSLFTTSAVLTTSTIYRNIVGNLYIGFGLSSVTGLPFCTFFFNNSAANLVDIVAVKLELGSTQTLAHQDANGNWVLNEIPDYGEELRKCQRYQFVIPRLRIKYDNSANIANVVLPLVFPTTMRVAPAITHDSVNGISIVTDYDKTHALLQIDPSTSVDATIENIIFDANL